MKIIETFGHEMFGRYWDFKGRTSRRSYFFTWLVGLLINLSLSFLAFLNPFMSVIALLWVFGTLIPTIATTTRRMHDVNKSAAWWVIVIVPFVNIIFFLSLLLAKGTGGHNNYGEDSSIVFALFCPVCDIEVSEEASFCKNCGIDFDLMVCSKCDRPFEEGDQFCSSCGANV